jgi:hypothetical protein
MPTWTTANRPTSPIIGAQGYNTTYGGVEVYNGSAWDLITGGPAFAVYLNNSQGSLTNTTDTKVVFDTKEFDTNNCISSGRFTPTVPGYYQLNYGVRVDGTVTRIICSLFKNGSLYRHGNDVAGSAPVTLTGSSLVYANGTTDYYEVYVYGSGSGMSVSSTGTTNIFFNGSFVRGI